MVRAEKSIVKQTRDNDMAGNRLIPEDIDGRAMYLNSIVLVGLHVKTLTHCFPPKLSNYVCSEVSPQSP